MPYRTHLFLDRLAGCIDIPLSQRAHLKLGLEGLAGQEEVVQIMWGKPLDQYRQAYRILVDDENGILIQVDPKRNRFGATGTHRFMRLEWNPWGGDSSPRDKADRLNYILSQAVPDFTDEWLLRRIAPTRLDFSFDVFGVHIEDLCVHSTLRRIKTTKYEYGQHGLLNAIYFGSPESDRRLVMYDKALHMKITQGSGGVYYYPSLSRSGQRILRRTNTCTRFELTHRKALNSLAEVQFCTTHSPGTPLESFGVWRQSCKGTSSLFFWIPAGKEVCNRRSH